ncbi:MAG: histidine triad nucleotide-binding protein [Dehalococcoidia bacterium]|nr:histidine triad nucleotide-binding protein [Dehalococcoidia bacterium]
MEQECIFCRIVAREVASDVVYEDTECLAFRDIAPQAPIHLLIIPKSHIPSVAELTEGQQELAGHLILIAKNLAEREGLAAKGYRLVVNCGYEGGQVVPHLHIHLIGGMKLGSKLG